MPNVEAVLTAMSVGIKLFDSEVDKANAHVRRNGTVENESN